MCRCGWLVERLLTLRQVAEILSVSFITTKRWIYSGRRKAVKLPTGKWRKIMRIPSNGDWHRDVLAVWNLCFKGL